jgi:ABC-type dipeptide/oligopeptide/nickel transport system permease component
MRGLPGVFHLDIPGMTGTVHFSAAQMVNGNLTVDGLGRWLDSWTRATT